MLWLYNIAIQFYGLVVKFYSLFNNKARLFINGRVNIFENISKQIDPLQKHIWFHFASLGEFEQGRSVLERIKAEHPNKKIVITFFSPSGYEIRRNYALADGVFYLPLDTQANAKKLLKVINPEIAVFTKYEFWYHYFKTLNENSIPVILISGIFRPDQIYFKWYGSFNRKILKYVNHFFVQNQESVELLNTIQISNVTLSGDTRFDRVYENSENPKKIQQVEQFVGTSPVMVAGSTWPADEILINKLIEKHANWKFIIAPHEINKARIDKIRILLPKAILLSEWQSNSTGNVLIIDNVGMLSSLYNYGRIAYIGGGFGVGIHNTLEAAAFGIPVIFGPNYAKFQEAKDLIDLKSGISINNETELNEAFELLTASKNAANDAKEYVLRKTGATDMIVKYVFNLLN
ncbi:3-deoxy-D-manno-octulosonic-acid transferase [Pedobacter sp. UYP24]